MTPLYVEFSRNALKEIFNFPQIHFRCADLGKQTSVILWPNVDPFHFAAALYCNFQLNHF